LGSKERCRDDSASCDLEKKGRGKVENEEKSKNKTGERFEKNVRGLAIGDKRDNQAAQM